MALLPLKGETLGYAFVMLPSQSDDYSVYRAQRTEFLKRYCMLLCLERPEVHSVLGIATDAPGSNGSSEDLILYQHEGFTPETAAVLRRIQETTGLLANVEARQQFLHEDEYPTPAAASSSRRSRETISKRKAKRRRRKRKRA